MRIAYVITRADAVGGATIHVRDLAREMIVRGHDARVFVGGTGQVTEQLSAAGVPFHSLSNLQRSLHPLRDYQAYLELRSALSSFAPDLISAHTAKAGWLGRAVARSLGMRVIYTPHGWAISDRISRKQGAVYTVAERIAAPWADGIVCVSEAERRLALAKRIAPEGKLHVIHNGVKEIADDLVAKPGSGVVRLISVARFEEPKDHRTLIHALRQIRDLRWELELVGEGPLEPAIRRQVQECEIADRVKFAGYAANAATHLSRSSIFLLSSRSEGFPRSILEAMRAGLPVIASDVGGIREAVLDGSTGFVVPSGSPGAISAALRRLITSSSLRERTGQAGRQRYQQLFRFECMASYTYCLYATLVGVRFSSNE